MKLDKLMKKIKNGNPSKDIPVDNLGLSDINRGLYEALFAISIYGDSARDEDVMNLIINGTDDLNSTLYKMRKNVYDNFMEHLENGEYVRSGDLLLDKKGRIKLQPKQVI